MSEAADGMAFLAMAGFNTNQILDTMPGLLDLAASSNMDLGRAADIATNILSGFGMEAAEAGRVADVLAKGASSANTSVEQLGGAMKYVAPVAASLGLEIEGMTAAVGLMSDAGIQGEQAGRILRQGLLRLASPTGAAADLIDELGINVFDANKNMKDLDQVVGELEDGLDGMSAQARTAALTTIFGAESVAGWTALLDRGGDELAEYTKDLQDAEGAASEMASIMQDNAKGAMIEFRSALEGVGIALSEHMIPTVTDMINKGTDLVRKFGELDESTQKNIIKMGAFAALIGPAAIVMGNLTTAVGGFLRMGGRVATMLGAAGTAGKGTGLLSAIGKLGPAKATPVGLAITGVGLLAGGLVYLARDMNKLHDVSTETADAMMDQYQSNNELIDSFDELRNKSNLTNDEFARYLDLYTRLESETDPQVIEEIKDEMDQLREKSGLSNDELEDMIGYNNDIIEVLPESTVQITEQGNRIADTTDNLRDYNQEIANMAKRELEAELHKALANELTIREQIKDAQRELSHLEETEAGLREIVRAHSEGTLDVVKEQLLKEKEKLEDAYREAVMRGEVTDELSNQIDRNEALLSLADADIDKAREKLSEIMGQVDKQRELIDEKQNELEVTGEIVAKMVEYELIAAGVNEETAKQAVKDAEVSSLLDEQLDTLIKQKQELYNQATPAERLTDEFQESVDNINEQIRKLETAKGNIIDLIDEAGEYNRELAKDVDKMVNVQTSPSISKLDSDLTRTLVRNINIRTNLPQAISAYAEGTNFHPGGPALVGEEGFELARKGSRWSLLNLGIYDLPRGTQVFPHDESKRILRALNNIPAYATGARPSGEANRVINELNNNDNPIIVNLLARIANAVESGQSIQIDGREVVRATVKRFDEGLNDLGNRRKAAWGGV